jgi:hypothetical protein
VLISRLAAMNIRIFFIAVFIFISLFSLAGIIAGWAFKKYFFGFNEIALMKIFVFSLGAIGFIVRS